MIVRWPGHVQGGEVNDTVWYFADFLPTAAELTGATIPSGLDGVSVMPTLLGQPQDLSDRMLYWEFHERGFKQAVRWGSWKGVRAGSGKPLQLFHLTADVAEQNELALQNPSIASRLERFLDLERTPSRHWPLKP